jgi:hypothetical protein
MCSAGGVDGAPAAGAAPPISHPRRPVAQIFATNNTAIITDPDDRRLKTRLVRFERDVRGTIRANGAEAGRSTLLNGVFWSTSLRQTTYERSREFDVNQVGPAGLHHIADLIRKQFHQESVLTFAYLPRTSPQADAVEIEVPGIDVRHLHDGLVADPVARDRLGGGSVTVDGRLILVAARTDLETAHRFVTEIGGRWTAAAVRYGAEEFVG